MPRKTKVEIDLEKRQLQPQVVQQVNYVHNEAVSHTHNISEITNLTTELSNKADINHNHQISDVQNLQTTLDGKANISHTHNISDVQNLQTILNSKADLTQVVRVDVNNQSLSNVEKINFLNNLNAFKAITYLSNININLNGNNVQIGTFSIPHKGNFIIFVRLLIQVVFMRNRPNSLQMRFQINSNEFNKTKYLNNFSNYYSLYINQTLSFECNYNFLHSFSNSDTLNLFLSTTLANNILSVSLLEGEILAINY